MTSSSLYFILPALGGYTLASLYLLKNPQILHRRKRTAFHCRHISHRGGCGERIENTMDAFTHAIEQGTEMLELDCHLTHDGHVVVSHDENLLRQTGCDITVSALKLQGWSFPPHTDGLFDSRFKPAFLPIKDVHVLILERVAHWPDLPLYKDKLEVTFYAGRYSSIGDRRFALLEDLFVKFPKMPVNIEIKEDNTLLIEKVSELVRRYAREDITVWATADSNIMKKCQRTNPSMPYGFSMGRGVLLLLLFYSGLLPFVPLGESFLQFYLPSTFNRTFIPAQRFLRNRWIIFLLEKVTMRRSLFEHLVARGIQVQLFVCNEDQDIETAFKVGATGVMTDYPSVLSNYLSRPRNQD